ncbi:hypothetical protein CO172_03370 [Candidatus Uhrbacteria bacterium CG_4_9_14_3_um_filter_36_7]|uniref:Uncharacterized protein n=1 Tax=Candidatus Uhrbacteria bacterium CG_4_9_14_3_um_filter_36_7 TaxID=1975033 RepID=A0A2M7XGG6_9BACT|nr:MAG: hypothetical protein CO172_03370 [Candidatus Uhrbacteria bacterium CG_4_9_14_3_um_filter_36_7]
MSKFAFTQTFWWAIPLAFFELAKSIIIFPFWWFTKGFILTLSSSFIFFKNQAQNLEIHIWIKNLFVPMYGATDIQGKLISFFLRLLIIFVRLLVLFIYLILIILFIIFYLLFLPVTIFGIWYFFSEGFFV